MTTTKQTKLNPRVTARLATYTAVTGAALAATAATLPNAKADIVYSGPLILGVPQNGTGIYFDFATGATSTTGSFTGYDINFYGSTALTFFKPSTTTLEAATTTGPALALTLGTNIGPTSVFSTSGTATNFQVVGTEYLGLRFNNTTTNAVNFGWVQLATGAATTGYPATVLGYAYENTGGAILAGQTAVPEPTTTATLGLGVLTLGAAGVRRWRRRNQAKA